MAIGFITRSAADQARRLVCDGAANMERRERGPPDVAAEGLHKNTARRVLFLTDSTRRAAGTQGGFLVPDKDSNSDLADRQRILRAKIGDVVHDSGRRKFQGFKARVVVRVNERTEARAAWFKDMLNDTRESNVREGNDDQSL